MLPVCWDSNDRALRGFHKSTGPVGLPWILEIVRVPFDFHSYAVYGYGVPLEFEKVKSRGGPQRITRPPTG